MNELVLKKLEEYEKVAKEAGYDNLYKMFNNTRHITNFTEKPLNEFTENDTIYIVKYVPGNYRHTHLCIFQSFEKGIVSGITLRILENGDLHREKTGKIISGRPTKCYLYGKSCCWFKKIDNVYKAQ